MPTQYDPDILQGYADDLYQQAGNIIAATAIKYGLVMFLVSGLGVILAVNQFHADASSGVVFILILTMLGVAAGISDGRRRAFKLKLEAQELLCQRQIEFNTRQLWEVVKEPAKP